MDLYSDNILFKAFWDNLINFCSTAEPSTEKNEIIESGLEVFMTIPGTQSASLFLYNQFTSLFTHVLSKGAVTIEDAEKYFAQFVELDAISESLNNGFYVGQPNLELDKIVILPLISQTGVDGLIFLICNSKDFKTEFVKLAQVFSNHFALKLSNWNLIDELNSVKDSYIDKVNMYTQEIAQSSRDLKKILDAVQTGVILFDKKNGEIVDVNIVAANTFGVTKEQLIGTERNSHFIFSDYKTADGTLLKSAEVFLKKEDGTIIQVISWLQELIINNESFIAESFIDITDRKQMETELQKAHDDLETRVAERTQKLVETNKELQIQIQEKIKAEEEKLKLYYAVQQSPAMIIITDLEGNIQYVNPIFTEITGYSFEEVLGKNPRFLKSGEIVNVEYNNMWGKIKSGGYWSGEFRNKKKNGELFWVSSFVSPIKNTTGDVINYLAVQQDITEKKISEQNLIEAKERAEKSDKLKSNLLANMSHEFRTPMIGIIGFTQMLQDEVADEEQLFLLNQLSQCNDRLMATINNIMNMSQLQSEDVVLTLEKFDLNELLAKVTNKFSPASNQKELNLSFTKENDFININVDRTLCELVFTNVIDNAIKYTHAGSVEIISRKFQKGNCDLVQVDIRDTGVGITEEQREKIFEPFIQLSTGYSRAQDGLGLGLAVSKKIVDLMKGRIIVGKNKPAGSIFRIEFPACLN